MTKKPSTPERKRRAKTLKGNEACINLERELDIETQRMAELYASRTYLANNVKNQEQKVQRLQNRLRNLQANINKRKTP